MLQKYRTSIANPKKGCNCSCCRQYVSYRFLLLVPQFPFYFHLAKSLISIFHQPVIYATCTNETSIHHHHALLPIKVQYSQNKLYILRNSCGLIEASSLRC